MLVDGKDGAGREEILPVESRSGVGYVYPYVPFGGIDLQRVYELNAGAQLGYKFHTQKTIVHHRVAQQELSRPIEQAVDGCKLFEIVLHSFDDGHCLAVLVLHHGILFQCFRPHVNLGQGVYLPDARFVRVENLTFADGDFQCRVEGCEKACHHVLKTVEHGQGAYQRQRSQCHSTHRNTGDDINGIVFLLGEEVAAGYKEGKGHYFSSSSIRSR